MAFVARQDVTQAPAGASERCIREREVAIVHGHDNVGTGKAIQAAAAKSVPLGRVGRLKEVGYLAVFLASPATSYVTGQTWAVDGGVSIQSA